MSTNASASFISYSRVDSEFALRLAEDLKAAGANVWLDQLDIPPGEEWDSAVEGALNQSPRMLLILSPSSAKSRSVRNEISFALDKEKIIVPVLYQDCDVPLQLRRIQHIDFRADYARGITGLLKALGAQSPQPEIPASTRVPPSPPPSTREAKKPGRGLSLEERRSRTGPMWLTMGIVLLALWLAGLIFIPAVTGLPIHFMLLLAVASFVLYFASRKSRG